MHVNAETFHTIFLSPAEIGQARIEIQELTEGNDVDWKQFPTLDRLTDAIVHGTTGEEI